MSLNLLDLLLFRHVDFELTFEPGRSDKNKREGIIMSLLDPLHDCLCTELDRSKGRSNFDAHLPLRLLARHYLYLCSAELTR